LAFLYDRLGDKDRARDWILRFFETYGAPNLSFPYLGIVADGDITAYLNKWRTRFPEVAAVSLVWNKKNPGPLPPQTLNLGVEMTNDAYYRLSDENGVLSGGLLHRGFNILNVSAESFFAHSGSHPFYLDLKADEVSLRKELTVSVSMTPEPETPEQELSQSKAMQYDLSLYVGDRLILGSSRTEHPAEPLKLNIKPVNLKANPLFKPPGEHDPFDPSSMGVSIPEAIGLIAGAIKDLVSKKPKKPIEPSVERLGAVGISYYRQGPSKAEIEVKATISLQARTVPAER
jgi:hypothetical protein